MSQEITLLFFPLGILVTRTRFVEFLSNNCSLQGLVAEKFITSNRNY